MKTGVFIGRFQPLHDGHTACIKEILQTNDRCIVMIRDTDSSEKNPFSFAERQQMIRAVFPDKDQVYITQLPDAGADLTIYIGRDVGYDLIQLDAQTESISATDIRQKLYANR